MKRALVALGAALAMATIVFVGVASANDNKEVTDTSTPENTVQGTNATNATVAAQAKRLRNFNLRDLAAQSGFNNVIFGQKAAINAANDRFFFSNGDKVRRIDQISITATINDGDSAPGDPNFNKLSLALDGIDTGIKLNGFRNGETDTVTNSGTPTNAEQIVAALRADKRLKATILEDPNDLNIVAIPANFKTTLQIKGKQSR
jgi:hypothetical protein